MQILYLYIPLPIFWALFDQQSSRWTLQAVQMNGRLGGWAIKPDQIQVVNPLLVIAMVPVFEWAIYPTMDKFTNLNRPLKKMVMGGLLAALSFIICGFFQLGIEGNLPVKLTSGQTHIGFINNLKCTFEANAGDINYGKFEPGLFQTVLENKKFDISQKITFTLSGDECPKKGEKFTPNYSFDMEETPESILFYLNEDIYEKNTVMIAPLDNVLVKPKKGGANMFMLLDVKNFQAFADRGEFFNSTDVKDHIVVSPNNRTLNSGATYSYLEPYEVSVTNNDIQLYVTSEAVTKLNTVGEALPLKQGAGYIGVIFGTYPDVSLPLRTLYFDHILIIILTCSFPRKPSRNSKSNIRKS